MSYIINPYFVSSAVTGILDGVSGVTMAASASRKLLTAYAGSFYTLDGSSHVTTAFNQTGSNNFSGTGSIVISNHGPNSRAAFQGPGAGSQLKTGAIPISTFFANNDGYVAVTVEAAAFATNSGNSYGNHGVVADTDQGYMGIYLKNNNTFLAYNFDSNDDHADNTITTSTPYVLEWWHTGGNVVGRVNGSGSGVSSASGNTGVMTGPLSAFIGAPSSTALAGYIWEIIVRNTAGTSGERDAIAADMKLWIGA